MPDEKHFVFRGAPQRLDRFLAGKSPSLSRTYLQRLVRQGSVLVDGKTARASALLSGGERVSLRLPDFSSLPAAAARSVPVLYEDAHILVVNKPAGLVVHPAGPHQTDTLIQRLWPKLAPFWTKKTKGLSPGTARPGVVHRLDRGTSGVMVIAKTPSAAGNLSRQFAGRAVKKTYWALAEGIPSTVKGRVQSTVGRSRRFPHRMSVSDPGRTAETEFTVKERFPSFGERGAALLEVRPLTGRTHQIRVQLASLGHAIVGDTTYGSSDASGARPLLHAFSIEITHPATGRRMRWETPPPEDFASFLERLR